MGLRDIFHKREEVPEVTPPIDDVLLRALLSNETITREKAMTVPAVAGAVDLISSAVATMSVRLYKVRDGKVEEVTGDTRTKLLNGDTGDTLDAYQLKKAMVEDYLMGKGGYCYIRKNRNDVTGLFYVEEQYVTIMKIQRPINKDYQIEIDGKSYKPHEFIKLLRNTRDGASGVGLTAQISKELEAAYHTLIYQLALVKSGGNKRGFLKAQRKLAQEEINTLKKAWKNLYENNTESVVVLNNGLEFQEASSSSVEMQLNESKRTLTDEINSLFHIDGDFDKTFKNAIYPVVKAFETALNRDLLLEREKKNHYFELDVKEIIRANIKERYEAYRMAKETGFMTINEIRKEENLNWIDGMDVINVGLGAVLYDTTIGKFFTPNTGETTDIGEQTTDSTTVEQAPEMPVQGEDMKARSNPNHDAKTGRFTTGSGIKGAQLEIIQKYNPMQDDYHTGIRMVNDIKTAEEAFKTKVDEDEDYLYPDFTMSDGMKALEKGKITVYSSKPISQGGFVSPSKMMAQDYTGGGKVYSKEVDINDVAWIDSNEGQYANINEERRKE